MVSCSLQRSWQGRQNTLSGGPPRGRGGSLERGGRTSRGRGYQYSRSTTYDGDQSDWSPRKEYNQRPVSMENWRRARIGDQEDEGWRGVGLGRSTSHEKWGKLSTGLVFTLLFLIKHPAFTLLTTRLVFSYYSNLFNT